MDARRSIRCLVAATVLLGGCAHVVHPPAPAPPQPKGYEIVQGRSPEVVARLRAAPAPAQPEVGDGRSIKSDETLLRGRGLVQIGIGHFDEADPARARERAVHTGRDVGADTVMVYPTLGEGLTAAYYVRLRLPFGASFRDVTDDERNELGVSGVQIGEVVGGTPADKANLLEGDFVLKFDHQPVLDKPSFQALLEQHVGKKVTLTIRRDGMTLERIVRLGTLAESGHK